MSRTFTRGFRTWSGFGAAGLALVASAPALGGSPSRQATELAVDTNWADNTLSIINLKSHSELNRIEVGPKPYDVKADRLGRFVYASLSGGNEISVVDLQANLEAYRITVGESPRDFVFTPDFSRLVVANSGSNSISVVDVRNKKELFQIQVGLVPYGVGLAAGGRLVIVSNWGEGTVSFVDLEAKKEISRIPVGHLPYTVAVSPAKDVAYTAAFGDDKVIALDLRTHSVLREIPVGKSPWGLSVDSSGSHVAVANFYSGSISVIKVDDPRAADGFSVETYELRGAKPGDHITASPTARKPTDGVQTAMIGGVERAKHVDIADNGTVLFTDLAANTVNTLDLNTGTLVESVPVGHAPYGIDFLPQEVRKSAMR